MKLLRKSEWFTFDKPIGELDIEYFDSEYHIERFVNIDGDITWFGLDTNWCKKSGGEWTKLTTNYGAKPLEKYLPEIVYGEDRTYFKKCDVPLYEKLYIELNENKL